MMNWWQSCVKETKRNSPRRIPVRKSRTPLKLEELEDRIVPAPTAAPGYTLTTFATNPTGSTQPDSIAIDGQNVYVGYNNGVAKDGSDGKSSTIVQYTASGTVVQTFSVPGHNDGLKVDPATHLVWALDNEDANPNLVVIDPVAATTTHYTFAATAHGGGYDDITFLGGKVFLSASNPSKNPNTAQAVVQVTLNGTMATVTPVLLGNATATNALTNMPVTLNLQDPDSMTADPSGDLVLTSQADNELVIIKNPGTSTQTVTLLPLTDSTSAPVSVDDTLFTPGVKGTILLTDQAGTIYQITGSAVTSGLVLSAAQDIGQVGMLSTATGLFSPVITGLSSPRGLAFLTTPPTAAPGYTLTTFATNPTGTSQPDSIAIDGLNVYVGYNNGVAKDGSDGKSSTIVQYTTGGILVQTFSVPGHNDGLKVDPATHLVWALDNEDANPNLVVINPTTRATTQYTFAPTAHGGGYDDITFLGGKVFMSASNPANNPNTAQAVVQVTLSGTMATVTPVLLGNATATNALTNMPVTLNLQDPDSMTADPLGDLVLTSQADNELVIIKNPGTSTQTVTLLSLSDQTGTPVSVDDTLFTPSATGSILLTDQGGAIYQITGSAIASGLVLSAAQDIGQVGIMNTSTGFFTPVLTGLSSPRGLAFLSTALTAASGYTVTTFATQPAGISGPDSIAVDGSFVYVGYNNGVAKDGSDGKSSTIVQYTTSGTIVQTFSVPGHNDGLKVDPATHLVWALDNEDANPNLVVINPTTTTSTRYTFAATAHGGGYDDITFLGGKVFLSASNPSNNPNTAQAIVQVTLSGTTATVTPILLGNATATNALTNMPVTLNLQDPDSMTADPSGDLVLTSQADNELVIVKNPGASTQSVTLLPLADATAKLPVSIDDTLFTPSSNGTILLTDQTGTIYRITGSAVASGLVLSAAQDIGQVGSLNIATGLFSPVITGLSSPRGLAFLPNLGFSGNTVSPVNPVAVIYSPHPNPDANTAFVRGLYYSVLGRGADASGLAFWVGQLSTGATPLTVAAGIWTSAEHRGEQVDSYYRTFLHRAADPAGRAFWVNQFLAGANEAAVTLGFATSPEYISKLTNSYLSALYQDILGRAVDTAGQQFWQTQLAAGMTMTQLASGIINSAESDLRAIDDYFVAFLQRSADASGESSWLQSMETGQHDFGSVAYGILSSGEYMGNAGHAVP
jgi:hypothetical protein